MLVFRGSRLDGRPDRLMDEPVKHSEARREILNHNSLMVVSVCSTLAAPEAQPGPGPPLLSSDEAEDASCRVILATGGGLRVGLLGMELFLHFILCFYDFKNGGAAQPARLSD